MLETDLWVTDATPPVEYSSLVANASYRAVPDYKVMRVTLSSHARCLIYD